MPYTIGTQVARFAPSAALLAAAWAGSAGGPATLIGRVAAVVIAVALAGLPWLVRRRFGPVGDGWTPRVVRVVGYALVVALLLLTAKAEQLEFAEASDRRSMTGLWIGEVVFLVVLMTYIAGLLAVTAQRAPANRTTLAIGGGAGLVLGVVVYGLRPLADQFQMGSGWLAVVQDVAKVLAIPLVLGAVLAAGIAAGRRAKKTRHSRLGLRDVRARQGLAAGICVGATAATVVSLLGSTTIGLMPDIASGLRWTLPDHHLPPGSLYGFEVSMTEAGAGYLLVLLLFPLLGAGLGAWGGMFAGDSGLRPDGGGGGGPHRPDPAPRPPDGGLHQPHRPAPARLDLATLLSLPEWRPEAPPARQAERKPAPERKPAGVP